MKETKFCNSSLASLFCLFYLIEEKLFILLFRKGLFIFAWKNYWERGRGERSSMENTSTGLGWSKAGTPALLPGFWHLGHTPLLSHAINREVDQGCRSWNMNCHPYEMSALQVEEQLAMPLWPPWEWCSSKSFLLSVHENNTFTCTRGEQSNNCCIEFPDSVTFI